MRGMMIWLGIELINRFDWILYGFGLLLLFAGVKCFSRRMESDPEKSHVLRLARRLLPIAKDFDGKKFITRIDGRKMLTPPSFWCC